MERNRNLNALSKNVTQLGEDITVSWTNFSMESNCSLFLGVSVKFNRIEYGLTESLSNQAF